MRDLQCTRAMLEPALAANPDEGLDRWTILDSLTAQDQQDAIQAALAELQVADAALLGKPGCGAAMNCHRKIAAILTKNNAPLERGA